MSTCLIVNMHISELNILVTLATDIILLLTMSFGLLRLGYHERSAFGLGRFLWKQVRYWRFWPWCPLSANILLFIHKGLIWLLVATIAEVLPAVGGQLNMPVPPLILMSQVFICLNLNGRFILSISSTKNIDD
jgi:hypothetical protein